MNNNFNQTGLLFDKFTSPNSFDGAIQLFQQRFGVDVPLMQKLLELALSRGGEFAELFFEYHLSHSILMEEDLIKSTSENIGVGVGIRVISGEKTGYGYTNDLNFDSMKSAALTAANIADGKGKVNIADLSMGRLDRQLYDLNNLLSEADFQEKISLVQKGYAAAVNYDSRVEKVQASLLDSLKFILVANSEGVIMADVRPQSRLVVSAIAHQNGNRVFGHENGGGRVGMDYYRRKKTPQQIGKLAAEEAIILLDARDALAGEQPVVLGVGQSGVMIHEAVGHPLEADANRKGTSIMSGKIGEKVASNLVTIYEDPTIPHSRGSLNIDDEGTVTKKTVLVEKGKLVNYIQDRLSAKIMKMELTGNGRRENYQFPPIPRMTNTILAAGEHNPEEIIRSVKKGFYAKSYQGGQVQDSGKFVFSVNLGYQIIDGKLAFPVKNATLIGSNIEILNNISMVGNDMDYFLGTCGKEGQSVPVTAGTPTLKIEKMTVGGRL